LLDRRLRTPSGHGSPRIISCARRAVKWGGSSPYSLESGRVVIRSRRGLAWGASCPCWVNTAPGGPWRARRCASRIHDPPPTNNGVPEGLPTCQDVAVLLDVSELGVDKIHLIVRDLRSHASVLPELVSLVNLQIGVHADLDEVDLGIKGVRAKVLLKVRLDNARHPRPLPGHHGGARGDPRGPHPDELLTGTRGNALRAPENVLGDLDVCGTVDGRSRAGWRTYGTPSGRS
jgi:hypothetical protein